MPSLQQQSDSAFQDPESMTMEQERAREDSQRDNDGTLDIQFAEDDGAEDFPAPEPLESDGKGLKKSTSDLDFAEDDTSPQGYDALDLGKSVEQPQQARQRREDLHDGAAPAEPTQEGLSDAMLARARGYGFNPNDIKSRFNSDEDLEKALLGIDQQMLIQAQMTQQMPQAPQQQRPMQPPPQQPVYQQQPPQPQQQPEQQQQNLWEVYKLQHPELYDDQLAADLNGISERASQYFQTQAQQLQATQQMVAQQQAVIQQFLQQQQQAERGSQIRQFDQMIQDLGPEWEEVFGLGEAEDLDPNSYQMFNRKKALQTVDQLRHMHRQQGRNVNLEAILPSSLQVNFPGRQITRSNTSDTSQPRDGKGRFTTAKPTSRNRQDKGLSARERALRKWDKVYGDNSYGNTTDDEI